MSGFETKIWVRFNCDIYSPHQHHMAVLRGEVESKLRYRNGDIAYLPAHRGWEEQYFVVIGPGRNALGWKTSDREPEFDVITPLEALAEAADDD